MTSRPQKTRRPSAAPDHASSQTSEETPGIDTRQGPHAPLTAHEAWFELAAEAANIGLWSLDLATRRFWITSKTRDIFRFSEISYVSFQEFADKVFPEDLPLVEAAIQRALQENSPVSVEYRIVHPDGSIRWLKARGALHQPAGGTSSHIMGSTVDITKRREKERAVARQRAFESLLVEISAAFAGDIIPSDLDAWIEQGLKKILQYFGVDRCGLIRIAFPDGSARITHAAYREECFRLPHHIDLAPQFPWAIGKVMEGSCYYFSSPNELPPEAHIDRGSWEAAGVKSTLSLPLPADSSNAYLIVVSSLTRSIVWESDILPRLQLLGEIFLNAMYRIKTTEELRHSYHEITRLKEKLEEEADYLREEVRIFRSHDEMVGESGAIQRVLHLVEQVAPTSSTVLLCGETGTGKELVARAIHQQSSRRDRMMVMVNCASLPASLIESELFGHERGAFTGAVSRKMGRFELADNSTIFLDEISELSLELQAKLLRVLQQKEFQRLGSPKTITVDVRVIAATNRDLLGEVRKGNFREDLYYRLNVFPIDLPPLRERLEDIPMLVWEFVREFNETMGKKVGEIARKDMESLQAYAWPGNIRELRNVIEYAAISSSGKELRVRLPESVNKSAVPRMSLEATERRHIEGILLQTDWRIKGEQGAARILGLNPGTLYAKMKKLGIPNQREKYSGLLSDLKG